jgi:hypothetical protein
MRGAIEHPTEVEEQCLNIRHEGPSLPVEDGCL